MRLRTSTSRGGVCDIYHTLSAASGLLLLATVGSIAIAPEVGETAMKSVSDNPTGGRMKHIFAIAVAVVLAGGGVGLASAQVADAALTCSTSLPANTQAKGTCAGSGTWRLKAQCQYELDKYTSYVKQTSGTTSLYKECTFKATGAVVEIS